MAVREQRFSIQSAAVIALVVLAVAAIVGLAALALLFSRTEAARTEAREAEAREAYRSFLALAVQNPDLAAPDHGRVRQLEGRYIDRYVWFVTHLVTTCDNIIANSDDETWEDTCRGQLVRHAAVLCDVILPRQSEDYTEDTQDLIRSAVRAAKDAPASCEKWKTEGSEDD